MVDERVTDGKRIAQLFASELSGLSTGRLSEVAVVNANSGTVPSADGTAASDISYRGDVVGTVVLHPDRAILEVGSESLRLGDVRTEQETSTHTIPIESGAAVKRAVDDVRELLD